MYLRRCGLDSLTATTQLKAMMASVAARKTRLGPWRLTKAPPKMDMMLTRAVNTVMVWCGVGWDRKGWVSVVSSCSTRLNQTGKARSHPESDTTPVMGKSIAPVAMIPSRLRSMTSELP